MPGFFATFMVLAACSAWSRYLADTRGPSWVIWVPAPGALVWLLAMVYAVAMLSGQGPDTSALPAAEAATETIQADYERLMRVRSAASAGQWAGVATLVATLGVSAWSWLRPPSSEEAG